MKIISILALLLAVLCMPVSARERISIGFDICPPHTINPPYQPIVSGGHYETRYETVLVEPGHMISIYINGYDEISYDGQGNRVIVQHPGYYKQEYIPARYETREVVVFVPNYRMPEPSFRFRFRN